MANADYVSFDVQKLTAAEGALRTLAGRSSGPCATAILHARTLLDRRRAVVEATRVDSIASARAGAKSSHQLEALERPTGRLSHGLQAFDPDGSGKIAGGASREVLRVN